jgi:rRNA maturation RNase YbeY
MESVSITSFVANYPSLAYQLIKDDILGKKYELSLTFIGTARAQKLNHEHRKKEYVPNVLSFPLDTNIGEIFITPLVAKKEAQKFSMSVDGYIGFLFIHALLHLKGLEHGDTMDRAEKKYCKKYGLK